MKVGEICSPRIRTVDIACTLSDAGEQMRLHGVDALVVTEPVKGIRRPVGLITDRELVVALIAKGAAASMTSLADVLVRRLVTVSSDAGIERAIQIMQQSRLRRLVVENEQGELIGFLTLDELLEALGNQLIGLAKALRSERRAKRVQAEPKSTRRPRKGREADAS